MQYAIFSVFPFCVEDLNIIMLQWADSLRIFIDKKRGDMRVCKSKVHGTCDLRNKSTDIKQSEGNLGKTCIAYEKCSFTFIKKKHR